MFQSTQKSNFTMKGTPVLGASQMSTTTDFMGNILSLRPQQPQNCNDTTMEDIRDALQIQETNAHYQPQILAQPIDQHQSMSNQSHVTVDDQELLHLEAKILWFPKWSLAEKKQYQDRVLALLQHHKQIVDTLQNIYDVTCAGLRNHDENQKMPYRSSAIQEAENILVRSQYRE